MLLGKEYIIGNLRKFNKISLFNGYDYSIFKFSAPLKFSKANIKKFSIHNSHDELGVLLNNPSFLEQKSNRVIYDNKTALAPLHSGIIVFKMTYPKDCKHSYLSWVWSMNSYIVDLSPNFLMLPLNPKLDISVFGEANKLVQELNSILLHFALSCDVVLYQQKESIASMSYIIHNIGFPTKTSLCLNLDELESPYYNLTDIKNDIVKFDITNKVSMIKTDKYTLNDSDFKSFVDSISDDIVVFGAKI